MFDKMPKCVKAATTANEVDELTRYFATAPEPVHDPIQWWRDHRATYPRLSRMAIDYLMIPGKPPPSPQAIESCRIDIDHTATLIDIERVFSRGCILLPHIRNRMTGQTTRTLMCLGTWSRVGLVHKDDLKAAALLPEVNGDASDFEMDEGWDNTSK